MTPDLEARPVGPRRARSLRITTAAVRDPALARALTPARTGVLVCLLALLLVLTGCQGASTTTPVSSGPAGIPQRAAAIDVSGLAPRAAYTIFEVTAGACEVVASSGGDDVVPVASAFKLWVLDAAARQVRAGTLTWDTPVIIRDELRSDPSGEAYNIPTGTSVPLQRMLTLMISISDNTATDHVLDVVGRDAVSDVVRQLAPRGAARTLPLLSTADMARLKFVSPAVGREYAGLGAKQRAAVIAGLPQRVPLPWLSDPAAVQRIDISTPSLVDDIEWFAAPSDLCRTMSDLASLSVEAGLEPIGQVLGTNPGLSPEEAKRWTTAWFKGGSEPGVLALVWRLAREGSDRVVVVTASDPGHALVESQAGQRVLTAVLAAAA